MTEDEMVRALPLMSDLELAVLFKLLSKEKPALWAPVEAEIRRRLERFTLEHDIDPRKDLP